MRGRWLRERRFGASGCRNLLVQKEKDAGKRNFQSPSAPSQFARQLVQCPVEQKGAQHHAQGLFVLGQNPRAADGLKIGLQVSHADPQIPIAQPGLEAKHVFGKDAAPLDMLIETDGRGEVKGAQHGGHVAQGRMFDTPFANGHEGIPFEVDEHKILACPKNLAKTAITVESKAAGGEGLVAQGAATLNDGRFQINHPLRQGLRLRRQRVQLPAQQPQGLRRAVAHGLKHSAPVMRRGGFRGEVFVERVGGQDPVQFGGAHTQKARRFQKGADGFSDVGGEIRLEKLHRFGKRHGGRLPLGDPGDDAVVVAAEGIQREIPGVGGRGDESVDDAQGETRTGGAQVFQAARHRLAVRKRMAVEKPAHLQFRIEARFEAAKKFEDQFVFENDGGVVLFDSRRGRFGWRGQRP